MKKIFIAVTLCCNLANISAQEFSFDQKERLDRWGLNYAYLIEQSEANEQQLWEILDIDRKRKNNLIMGSTFAGLGLVMLAGGSLIFSQDSGCDDAHICENTGQVIVGGGLMALGTFEVGVSLPLFLSSLKRKKKRNKMVRELNLKYGIQSQLE
ncbi:hypothetical protein PY092_02715 [Muricauda sp. 334s03]|uniref:Uncharacterized protein n=1 Tax=Flagellimonas yonaguniensis TaxID=3031325 RepID=A0ABT5XV59_9FLAO|nr:hypothetical protein [[Muricauda] yonaguniensis]MDF0715049.1 hypothetical protein [[Muricauda] yonaguniensis]